LRALQALSRAIERNRVSPTLEELAEAMGLRSKSAVQRHVIRLGELGLVSFLRTGRRHVAAHSVQLTEAGRRALFKYEARRTSPIFHGTRELALTAGELGLARAVDVPVDAFLCRTEPDRVILRCTDAAERDFWADVILDALAEKGGLE
jgi:DNA-binding transcriptional ArsR family regulator